MVKRLALCLLLMLTSCLVVEDLGPYWDKAKPDPALVGIWAAPGEERGREALMVTAEGGHQRAVEIHSDGKPVTDALARSLEIKGMTLLLLRSPRGEPVGILIRYDMQDGLLRLWGLIPEEAEQWLAKHPEYSGKLSFNMSDHYGNVISAKGVMDEAFLDMLAALPPELWKKAILYRKLSEPVR